jgi:hypothetical protein
MRLISKEIQSMPPDMPAEQARLLQVALSDIYRDLVSLMKSTTDEIRSVTEDYDVVDSDYTVLLDGTDEAVTATLPSASIVTGKIFVIKCIEASNACNIATTDTIDGSASDIALALGKSRTVQSDGSVYWILGGVV